MCPPINMGATHLNVLEVINSEPQPKHCVPTS